MRILFVHDRFGAFGGAESNILATAGELKSRGHTVGILHGPHTGKGESAWQHTFQHCYSIHSGRESEVARGALASFQPDVVYLHKMADLGLLKTLLRAGAPIARMVHDHDLYCMRSYKYNQFTRHICERPLSPYCLFPCGAFVVRDSGSAVPVKWVSYSDKLQEREINQQFQRLIVATQFMKEQLLRNQFSAEKIEVHAPVPPRGESAGASTFSDRNYIVYAGQINRGKGVDVLLESLAQVRLPFSCFIFGDGNHRDHCERLSAKLGLANRVFFKGFVSTSEIAAYYRECSVVAVSSVWPEPFGAVGLEAMHFGLPVVAFDVGGIKEWLINGHNGFLVPTMDRAAFARKVETLLGDKTLARQMGQFGRELVARQFQFSNYISGLEKMFARLAEERASAIAA